MEIMIVIFLIGLIGSVIGYNMKGSIDEGRFFKSEQAAAQIKEILLLELASGADIDDVKKRPAHYVERTGLLKGTKSTLDGWGNEFKIDVTDVSTVEVTSAKTEEYRAVRKKKTTGHVQKD